MSMTAVLYIHNMEEFSLIEIIEREKRVQWFSTIVAKAFSEDEC